MSTESTKLEVLIVGSGIGGPCFAWWLYKLLPNVHITIVERSPEPRLGGQAVDLRSAAITIVDRMGLLQAVKDKHTTEAGVDFIYKDGKTKATFEASGDQDHQSGTSEFEILRGDMAEIMYNATKDLPNITYVFDETVTQIEQADASKKVNVTFANGFPQTSYDFVVGSDGMTSRTRRLVFGHGPRNDNYLYRLGQYAAYYTIPRTDEDTKFAQWYNATRGRLIFKRPDPYGTTRVYMAVTDGNLKRFDELDALLKKGSRDEQQAWFEKEFEGAGWQCPRMVEGMKTSKDFYMQQIAQVKMDKWSKGNVALVGDAAFCPSPISGVGMGSAILGAYILAGEVSRSPNDIPAALERYEATTRPYVEKVQKLVPGAPQVANPQTEWGIAIFNHTLGFASHPFMKRFGGLVGKLIPAFGKNEMKFPDYLNGGTIQ